MACLFSRVPPVRWKPKALLGLGPVIRGHHAGAALPDTHIRRTGDTLVNKEGLTISADGTYSVEFLLARIAQCIAGGIEGKKGSRVCMLGESPR